LRSVAGPRASRPVRHSSMHCRCAQEGHLHLVVPPVAFELLRGDPESRPTSSTTQHVEAHLLAGKFANAPLLCARRSPTRSTASMPLSLRRRAGGVRLHHFLDGRNGTEAQWARRGVGGEKKREKFPKPPLRHNRLRPEAHRRDRSRPSSGRRNLIIHSTNEVSPRIRRCESAIAGLRALALLRAVLIA